MNTTMRTATLDRELHVHEGEMFLLHKPLGWSSFDVVNKIRSIFHIQRIGHAGTLDKNATGLLIICTGKMTKQLASFQECEKEYSIAFRLGERTESFDSETPVIEYRDASGVRDDDVLAATKRFVGMQMQFPPMWSAAKIDGTRLYKYARKGVEVERRAREVHIKTIDVTDVALPDVEMTVVCSKGTYVRTLVNDIGNTLQVGAHITSLSRTRIGEFRLADAITIENLLVYREVHRN